MYVCGVVLINIIVSQLGLQSKISSYAFVNMTRELDSRSTDNYTAVGRIGIYNMKSTIVP